MAADIPFMEVTGGKDVQNGLRSILKMTTGFGLFSLPSKVKVYFSLLFTSNLSYFKSFKLPNKIRLLAFRSPLSQVTQVISVSLASCITFLSIKYCWFELTRTLSFSFQVSKLRKLSITILKSWLLELINKILVYS